MEPTINNINKNGLGDKEAKSCIPFKHYFWSAAAFNVSGVHKKQQNKRPLNGPCLPVQIQKSKTLWFPWRTKFFDDYAPRSKINLQEKSPATTHCIMSQFDWSSTLSCNTTFKVQRFKSAHYFHDINLESVTFFTYWVSLNKNTYHNLSSSWNNRSFSKWQNCKCYIHTYAHTYTHFNYSFISANRIAYLNGVLDRKPCNMCSCKNINAPFAGPGYSRWNM